MIQFAQLLSTIMHEMNLNRLVIEEMK